jgi:hypothetical protein
MTTAALKKYSHITKGRYIREIKLTQHEECAVLMAYDYGVDMLGPEDRGALDSLIFKLKTEIWP